MKCHALLVRRSITVKDENREWNCYRCETKYCDTCLLPYDEHDNAREGIMRGWFTPAHYSKQWLNSKICKSAFFAGENFVEPSWEFPLIVKIIASFPSTILYFIWMTFFCLVNAFLVPFIDIADLHVPHGPY